MMEGCKICNAPLKDDLFSFVTQENVCSICKLKYIGGLPTTDNRISLARKQLGLSEGEYLQQNNPEEAAMILGREMMSIDIMDILRNADYNLQQNGSIGFPIAKDQLRNAVILLEKGFTLSDEVDVNELAEKYGSLEDVPDKEEEE